MTINKLEIAKAVRRDKTTLGLQKYSPNHASEPLLETFICSFKEKWCRQSLRSTMMIAFLMRGRYLWNVNTYRPMFLTSTAMKRSIEWLQMDSHDNIKTGMLQSVVRWCLRTSQQLASMPTTVTIHHGFVPLISVPTPLPVSVVLIGID